MRLLPLERLTLRSDDPPDVVQAKLASVVSTRKFSLRAPQEPFRGTIKGRRFKVVRVSGAFLGMRSRNSWQPVIVGEVVPAVAGTEVRVRMRLEATAAAVTVLWFGGLLWGAGMMMWKGLVEGFGPHVGDGGGGTGAGYGLLLTLGMMLVGYAMVSAAFWTEVKKAKALLRERLGCHEVVTVNRLVRR